MTKLRIFTLNVWGLPGPTPIGCQYRKERIAAIGQELAKGEYDIALLQEVWLKTDYKCLADKICTAMPHTHYFYSGMVGSGLCVFSKGPIRDMQFFRFHLNGYAHKLQHGDWFGGKGVGMCVIDYKDLRIHVYTAHLHAEYNRLNDEYQSHRIAQSFELSQVVKLTAGPQCDLVILAGDLNHEPVDLGFKIILANTGLEDAWITKPTNPDDLSFGNTCDIPSNSFASPSVLKMYPEGKRIDYILYKSSQMKSVVCEQCLTPDSMVPGTTYNLSDHEPISALLDISTAAEPNMTGRQRDGDDTNLSTLLTHAITVMDKGLADTSRSRTMYLGIFIACFAVLCATSTLAVPSGLDLLLPVARILLVIGAFHAIWSYVVSNKTEENAHMEVRAGMSTLHAHLAADRKHPAVTDDQTPAVTT